MNVCKSVVHIHVWFSHQGEGQGGQLLVERLALLSHGRGFKVPVKADALNCDVY